MLSLQTVVRVADSVTKVVLVAEGFCVYESGIRPWQFKTFAYLHDQILMKQLQSGGKESILWNSPEAGYGYLNMK